MGRVQLALPGLTLSAARPLVPLEAVQVLLDRDEDAVLALVEKGDLGWAWDIRTPTATRREVRVWRESVLELMGADIAERHGTCLGVLDTFLPHRDLRLTELARWFACSSSHVSNLIRDGCLALAGERPDHSSVAAVTRITRASVVSLLDGRRIL